jgi:hypothetical protein
VSSFSGLNIGLSSLYAQRAGLQLSGHNVANANTEGYSRQRVGLAADGGPLTPAMHSVWKGAGNGVTVTGFDRMRDVFLESRALQERGAQSQLATGSLVLSRVESIFAEPGESALRAQLDDFWAGWSDIANKPTEEAPRNQLLQRAQTVAAGLNTALDSLGLPGGQLPGAAVRDRRGRQHHRRVRRGVQPRHRSAVQAAAVPTTSRTSATCSCSAWARWSAPASGRASTAPSTSTSAPPSWSTAAPRPR